MSGAVSGGVDSTVGAKLVQAAVGDRFHAVLVCEPRGNKNAVR